MLDRLRDQTEPEAIVFSVDLVLVEYCTGFNELKCRYISATTALYYRESFEVSFAPKPCPHELAPHSTRCPQVSEPDARALTTLLHQLASYDHHRSGMIRFAELHRVLSLDGFGSHDFPSSHSTRSAVTHAAEHINYAHIAACILQEMVREPAKTIH